MSTGTIEYRLRGQKKYSLLSDVTSLAAVESFGNFIDDYTNASIHRVSETVSTDVGSDEETGPYDDVGLFALLILRDENDDIYKIGIPAPKIEHFEMVNTRLYYKTAQGVAIAAALSALIGHTLRFERGSLCGKGA